MIKPRPKRRSSRRTISLKTWIEETGINAVAQLLDVDPSAVCHWKSGRALPRDDQKRFIKNFTEGRVSYEQIIDGHPDREVRT